MERLSCTHMLAEVRRVSPTQAWHGAASTKLPMHWACLSLHYCNIPVTPQKQPYKVSAPLSRPLNNCHWQVVGWGYKKLPLHVRVRHLYSGLQVGELLLLLLLDFYRLQPLFPRCFYSFASLACSFYPAFYLTLPWSQTQISLPFSFPLLAKRFVIRPLTSLPFLII